MQTWFAELLRDAFAVQLSGVFAPLRDFAGHHLYQLASGKGRASEPGLTPESAGAAIAKAWKAAEPYPDVGPALRKLQHNGMQVAAMTNGSIEIAAAVLERAGLDRSSLVLYDINEPKAWKPDGEAYAYAVNALALQPHEVMMVAAHPWDCFGAMQAGLKAAYVRREPSELYPGFLDKPHLTVDSFEELATALCAS